MMLGVSGLLGGSGDGAAAEGLEGGGGDAVGGGGGPVSSGTTTNTTASTAGGGGLSEDEMKARIEEFGERNSGGGNRWPRQETLALLKIRSDMDVTFRDSSLKGPLWEEVSRKMAELGYHRSAKKCKEKFENVYKYHKRTKDGRATKPEGKTYRFFDQLEALDTHHSSFSLPPPPPAASATRPQAAVPISTMALVAMPTTTTTPTTTITNNNNNSPSPIPIPIPIPNPIQLQVTVPSTTNATHTNPLPPFQQQQQHHQHKSTTSFLTNSSSSSTSSDDEREPERRRRRKRKWKDFFERLMKEVVEKQEELQKKFLDTLERRERDRTMREEAWRVQEMARMNREHDLLVQERSMAAAKDAAVIAFLQKMTDPQNSQNPSAPFPAPMPPPPPEILPQMPVVSLSESALAPTLTTQPPQQTKPIQQPKIVEASRTDNGGGGDQNFIIPASSSRWPKSEVEALIRLRTNLDLKYQENGPKGPLWEEISAAMRKIGYNRSSKRCKEKWENINKYFKKVKESNKKRPEDSKTCPYFHQLDVLYRQRAKSDVAPSYSQTAFAVKPENSMVPIMARPEQQWPVAPEAAGESGMEDHESENEEDGDDNEDEEEDDDDVGGYEIVTNKPSSTVHE